MRKALWPIPCPNCSKNINKKTSWFKRAGRVCPHCRFSLDGKDFQKEVIKTEKTLKMARDNYDLKRGY